MDVVAVLTQVKLKQLYLLCNICI